MFKFDQVQEYVTLAKTLSFSKTAEISCITQPALTRHIHEIEEEMGTRLFDRTTRSVSITPAGAAVLEEFEEILMRFQAAHERASLLSSGKTGTVEFLSPYYWTEDYAEPLIERFLHVNPLCNVRVISCQPSEGYARLLEGDGDILLSVYFGNRKTGTGVLPIGQERLAAVMPLDHPLARRDSLSIADLAGSRFAFLSEDAALSARFNVLALALLASHGVEVTAPQYSQQVDTLGMTIKHTGCIGFMPYGVRHMDRSYLRVIPLSDDDCSFPMCLIWRTENENPVLRDFIETAREASGRACAEPDNG